MYNILHGISNIEGLRLGRVYVIEASDGLTLIDTSAPGSFPQIEKGLLRSGHQISEMSGHPPVQSRSTSSWMSRSV